MSEKSKVVGGKLKLKGIGTLTKARSQESLKRTYRDFDKADTREQERSKRAKNDHESQLPQRIKGIGTILSSGTTLHGHNTKFMEQLSAGDAIQIMPSAGSSSPETRKVAFVLSDISAALSAPFSLDIISRTSFEVIKILKQDLSPEEKALLEATKKDHNEAEALGIYRGSTGEKSSPASVTYRVKLPGAQGGYKTVTEKIDGVQKNLTREELLDIRAKKMGRDKFC